ncbi:MAG: phage holin family protein [Saprospiraceae bacterium]
MDLLLQATQMGVGGLFIQIIFVAAVTYGAAYFLSGIQLDGFKDALILAVVLALLNATVGWLLRGLSRPLDWITLGLLTWAIALVVSAVVIKIADALLGGFAVKNFVWAVILAAIISLSGSLFGIAA